MKGNENKMIWFTKIKKVAPLVFLVVLSILFCIFNETGLVSSAQSYGPSPVSPINISVIQNTTRNITPVASYNLVGGNYSLVSFNSTISTSRWNAFVGNVTGFLGLYDSQQNTLFGWEFEQASGEIIAVREEININWTSLRCANNTEIYAEETKLGIDTTSEDSINNTFTRKEHSSFILAANYFNEDECFSIKTKVNNASQDVYFSEMLLSDKDTLVYVTQLEDNTQGFDGKTYDFQLILPTHTDKNTKYNFFTELV
jgi:hypothetical protein